MSFAEAGAYWGICAVIYAKGGPVDIDTIRRLLGGRGFDRLFERLVAIGKVQHRVGIVSVSRCDQELERSRSRAQSAHEAASKRWKLNETQHANGHSDAYANNLHTTIYKQQKETRASRAPSKSDDFDRWWEGYPEKVGKGAARKAFEKALTKTSVDVLIAGVERYKAHKPVDRPWCNPATWLNQERWNDVYGPQPNGANGHLPVIEPISPAEAEDLKRRIWESIREREDAEQKL